MMKTKRVIFVLFVLMLIVGSASVSADSAINAEIYNTWTKDTINANAPDVANLSTIFVGKREVPYMIYVQQGVNRINQVWEATEASPGNCGTDNKWHCEYIETAANEKNVSNLATENYIDTFSVSWVYSLNDNNLWGYTNEYRHDMTYVTTNAQLLLQLGKFGPGLVSLAGPPSIARSGGHFYMAVTLKIGIDMPTYKLVYLYDKGGENTSCVYGEPTRYDCIVIQETATGYGMGAPALIFKDHQPRIIYYANNAIRYAYPWETYLFKPSNCGVTGNTWRCIDLLAPSNPTTVGKKVDLAVGREIEDLAAAYTIKPTLTSYNMLHRAEFVGSGGDCGEDITVGNNPIFTWECGDLDNWIDDTDATTFHIAYDNLNYPVISYNNKLIDDDNERQRLYVGFDVSRIGLVGGVWNQYLVDGNDQSTTGLNSDIAFSSKGRAFIGYVQPYWKFGTLIDNTPDVRVATQWFTHTYLPAILK